MARKTPTKSNKSTSKPKKAAKKTRATKKSKNKSSNKWLNRFKYLLNVSIWTAAFLSIIGLFFIYDLPDIQRLSQSERRPGISIVAQDGSLVATSGDIYGSPVSVDNLPPHVWQAILAIEDRRFFSHFGIDVFGLGRAIVANFQADRLVQGGSTITQQLAKNFFLSEKMYAHNDRSFRRKIQEVLFSFWLEHKFTKKQILSIYLNRVYLGAGVYGVEAAAQKYFSKKAKSLNVYESAVIAGLLKAPSKYSPSSSPERAHERATVVLSAMVDSGYIKQNEADKYKIAPKNIASSHTSAKSARYFVDWIIESLPNYIGEVDQDILVITTLNPKLQKQVEMFSQKALEEAQARDVSQLAVVTMTPDGAVRALVGGGEHSTSQYNRATQARRQAGSAIKPLVFLAGLEKGWQLDTPVSDAKICLKSWCPKNYGWQSRGDVRFQDALAYSINTATVRMAHKVGWQKIAEVCHRLGLKGDMPRDLSIVLGSIDVSLLELTSAYATFANGGQGTIPYGILEIRDRKGKILYRRKNQSIGRLVDYNHAKQMTHMLTAVIDHGTGKRARLNVRAAGKTGTSQNHKDAWFIGYAANPALVTGVWMGNDDNKPMKKVTGGNLPAELWKKIMSGQGE